MTSLTPNAFLLCGPGRITVPSLTGIFVPVVFIFRTAVLWDSQIVSYHKHTVYTHYGHGH